MVGGLFSNHCSSRVGGNAAVADAGLGRRAIAEVWRGESDGSHVARLGTQVGLWHLLEYRADETYT